MIQTLLLIGKVIFFLAVIHITVQAISLYLHRDQTHRSVDLKPGLRNFYKIWLWWSSGMSPKQDLEWIGLHRKHHAKADSEEDPHNPESIGPWKLFVLAYPLYVKEVKKLYTRKVGNETEYAHYTRGLSNDATLDRVLNNLPFVGLALSLATYSLLLGWFGFIVWFLQFIWMPVAAGGVINVLGHTIGHIPYQTKDTSRSLSPTTPGFLGWKWILVVLFNWGTCGEHLHNPHHNQPSSASFGPSKKLNFDIGYWWLVQFKKIGLIDHLRVSADYAH